MDKKPRKYYDHITIYTDGSSNSSNGSDSGACAFIALKADELEVLKTYCRPYMLCNSFQAEMRGVIDAIKWWRTTEYYTNPRKRINKLVVKCDCKPVVTFFQKMPGSSNKLKFEEFWKRQGMPPKTINNKKLWEELFELRKRVKLKWVKGHGSNAWNIMADYMAGTCRKKEEEEFGC